MTDIVSKIYEQGCLGDTEESTVIYQIVIELPDGTQKKFTSKGVGINNEVYVEAMKYVISLFKETSPFYEFLKHT